MTLRKNSIARLVRWATLAASAAFFLFFSRFISIHAICPIGGFEMFFTGLFKTGFTVAGLFSGMVLTFIATSLLSIVFRRAYCSYLCPIGAAQELFERLGKLVIRKRPRWLRVPARLDKALRWVKYGVLAAFVVGAALTGTHWMLKADPFVAFMGLGSGGISSTFNRNPSSVLFLAGILVFSFFLGRGFCSYLCPAGAWYGLLSKLSPNKVKRDAKLCVGCGKCTKACPMGIDVEHLTSVTSAECLGCRECVAACPKEGALSMPIAGKAEIQAALVPLLSAAVFAGGVYLAKAATPARGSGGHGPSEGGSGNRGGAWSQGTQGSQGAQPTGSGASDGAGGSGGVDATAKAADSPVDGSVGFGSAGYGGCPGCVGCGICAADRQGLGSAALAG